MQCLAMARSKWLLSLVLCLLAAALQGCDEGVSPWYLRLCLKLTVFMNVFFASFVCFFFVLFSCRLCFCLLLRI